MDRLSEMKVAYTQPPNYRQFAHYFPGFEGHRPVFCYGDVIYNPFSVEIGPDLIEHEAVHARQQGHAPDAWWIRYFTEPAFRLEQEVEAYRAQYRYVAKRMKDRETLFWYATKLAEALASPLYGDLVTKSEARRLIKS